MSPSRKDSKAEAEESDEVQVGDEVSVSTFEGTQKVDITGTSKGRGFAGTIKRWGFSSGPKSHGSKNIREPGSIGMHTDPGRVHKGKKLPGRYGGAKRTVKNLEVVRIEPEDNLLFVRGAVPGPKGGYLVIRQSQ